MADLEKLEARVSKLESQGPVRFFFQYVFSPLLLLSVGWVLNSQMETTKQGLQKLEMAQRMVVTMFSGNHHQAFATQRLLAKVLDKPMADELNAIFDQYYKGQVEAQYAAKNVETVAAIYAAAKSVGGEGARQVVEQIQRDPEKQQSVQNYQLAAQKEREGFEKLNNGKVDEAIQAFEGAEAAYPSFHQAYEISRLLKEKRTALKDPVTGPETQQQVKRQIADKLSWGAPRSAIQQMQQAAPPPQ